MTVLMSGGVVNAAASGIIASGHIASGVLTKEVFIRFNPPTSGYESHLDTSIGLEINSGGNARAWWSIPQTWNNVLRADLYTMNRLGNIESGMVAYDVSIRRLASGNAVAAGIIASLQIVGQISGGPTGIQEILPVSNIIFSGALPNQMMQLLASKWQANGTYNLQGLRIIYE